MKALIFNSGLGKRMGELTKNNHKSMVKLKNGETIFERQIRLLSENGVKDFVITTGPYEEQFIEASRKACFNDCSFKFVRNPVYDKTNYIYSFYLAKELIDDDFLVLHGDLVFNNNVLEYILTSPFSSTCMINEDKPLPEKDFKGRIIDGKLREVSISIFDKDCYTFQPLYKLDKATITAWVDRVSDFIENRGINSVYAENALNEITEGLNIIPLSYSNHYVEEIDNVEDYDRVCAEIEAFDAKEQIVLDGSCELENCLKKNKFKKPLVIISDFLLDCPVCKIIKDSCSPIFFTKFKPNPLYEDVVKARRLFIDEGCDSLISVGGGSAIDTAKAVKLFMPLDEDKCFLDQERVYTGIKHIAVPTTAGTGSESTKFSVIYYEGKKQSLADPSIIPDVAVLEPSFLKTLPFNQKRATVLDALCQATESLWSINATDQSRIYARESIELILKNLDKYIEGDEGSFYPILRASNLAGKAINITQTTAAHAMSYKITSLFNIPHGAAVAMCMLRVWMHYNDRSKNETVKASIARAYGADSCKDAYEAFNALCYKLSLLRKVVCTSDQLRDLIDGVNPIRLKNYPIPLTKEDIEAIYSSITIKK